MNCRHRDTKICEDWLRNRAKYRKRKGKELEKKYCKFWAYDPNGNKMWNTQP